MADDSRYQNVGFHFAVSISGTDGQNIDARFQSVSGLDASIETENIKEGGENRFEHKLPVRRSYSDLVLKRGQLSTKDASFLTRWCKMALESQWVAPLNIDIILLDENHEPLMKWEITHAWPKKWKFGELNAERSEVLIETIEFNYNFFKFVES